ncbi:MAG TPA: hypothetical protein VFI17_08250 [Solirubrobacterales bacterium]|nr:hypothetical protein [Solirubrobacterales bacterium]
MSVVSLHAHRALAPRGERTRHLVARLERDWEVELVAPPPTLATGGAAGSGGSNPLRRLAARGISAVLLDKWEPWSAKRLGRWQADCDAALLIGHPYSPLVYASRRLRAAGIPYVVDVGDPWVLTAADGGEMTGIARYRARAAERRLWHGAAGAVLTTEGQAEGIAAIAPQLPILVRPNGYDEVETPAAAPRRDDRVLRIAHFGMFNSVRIDPRPLLRTLAGAGLWDEVRLIQFGDDFVGFLDGMPPGVEVERNPTYPWPEVLERARSYDLALVVGNVNPDQLPSKAVQYLTLPIPRLALAEPGDALSTYVADKPGWLTLGPDDGAAAQAIAAFLARDRAAAELAAPASESWPEVADTIAGFIAASVAAVPAGVAG